MEKTEYDIQAEAFLEKTGTEITWKFKSFDVYFSEDKEKRLIWEFTISRGHRSYTSTFGQSIAGSYEAVTGKKWQHGYASIYDHNTYFDEAARVRIGSDGNAWAWGASKKRLVDPPTSYDLLACLEKSEPDADIDSWASDLGYDLKNSKIGNIIRIHTTCREQYAALCALFNDEEMSELQEIN